MTNTSFLDATRTDDEKALESVLHCLTMYFSANRDNDDELGAFYASQDAMRALAGGNAETETHLLLVDAKQWYRSLIGREWEDATCRQ